MDEERTRFATAAVAGFIVMILFALVTVNFLKLIPLAGPFAGGLVAGYLCGKDYLTGGKAGMAAGTFGALAVWADFILNTNYLPSAVPSFPGIAGVLFLILAIIYFPVLAFIGGAFGGFLKR